MLQSPERRLTLLERFPQYMDIKMYNKLSAETKMLNLNLNWK